MGRKKGGADSAPPKLTPEQRAAERRERFLRLAEKRMANALRAVTNVGRMANRQAYSYYDSEGTQLCESLERAVKAVRQAFFADNSERAGFQLIPGNGSDKP